MSLKTYPYDTAEFLTEDEHIAAYAEAVIEDGDPELFRAALDNIARAYGFATLAERSGLPRQGLFDALRAPERDRFETLKAVLAQESSNPRREAAE